VDAAPATAHETGPGRPGRSAPARRGPSVEDCLERAARLLAGGGEGSVDLAECRRRLARAIEEDPEAAGRLVDLVAGRQEGDPLALLAIEALGDAGTAEAQAGLGALARLADAPRHVRGAALLALARAERPGPGADDLFLEIHEEGGPLAAEALAGLGMVGDRIRERDPARFERLERYLVDTLQGDRLLPQEDLLVLEALGSLGPGAPPPAVRRAFDSEDDLVREAAARALRKTRGPEVDRLLGGALRDESIAVRLAAVGVLAERGGGVEMLAGVVSGDASEDVRAAALRALAPDLAREASLASLFERAGRSDPSDLVRGEAERILGSGPRI
jgi:HEAT repeat protein